MIHFFLKWSLFKGRIRSFSEGHKQLLLTTLPRHLFYLMDADGDGTLDWEESLGCLLLGGWFQKLFTFTPGELIQFD